MRILVVWLAQWVHTPVAGALGQTLFHFLWEGSAIALALTATLIFCTGSRARYGLACAAMLAMAIAFGVTLSHFWPMRTMYTRIPAGIGFFAAIARHNARALPMQEPFSERALDEVPWLAPFWIAGAFAFQVRCLGSWLAAKRLRRVGTCAAPAVWQERTRELAGKLHLLRSVTLVESCLIEAPAVIGLLKPVILMPLGLLANMPGGQIEYFLIHELAHIRRFDYLANLLQSVVEGLLFYHPAMWWVSGVVRQEREKCCDDVVLQMKSDARSYAAALASLEEVRCARGAALAAAGGDLMGRIQHMLKPADPRRTALPPIASIVLLLISMAMILGIWQPRAFAYKPETATITPSAPGMFGLPVQTEPAGPFARPNQATAHAQPQVQTQSPIRQPPAVHMIAQAQSAPSPQMLPDSFRKWLNQDVVYIISDVEKAAFNHLNTDEERWKFIEQFWLRRDPTPGTPQNEYQEEHYRRIGYANDHFATATAAGWTTDRGRIYIQFGPPDDLEDHPSGAFPFQRWTYRHIEGAGENVTIEFVDASGSGHLRMTMDPDERDKLLHPPK